MTAHALQRGQTHVLYDNEELLLTLRGLLVDYKATAEPLQGRQYSCLQLWALYVGAHAEQVASQKIGFGVAKAEDSWYSTRLAICATGMGLRCRQDVRAVLRGAHHDDGLRPQGTQWFLENRECECEGGVAGWEHGV